MRRIHIDYLILLIFIGICFFYGLGSYAINNINEGLYAEIPREMLESGNFIIPHLNYVPYLEKPPLLYWLIAVSYQLFGISAWSARLVPACACALISIVMMRFAKREDRPETGFLTGLMLTSCVSFILMARVILFDMVFALWLTLSLVNFYYWYQSQQARFLRWMYFFIGLAVLTKGLMAIFFVGGIGYIYLLLSRAPLRYYFTCFDGLGLLILLAVTVPWHLAASLTQSEFAYQYFINEHVLRFLDLRVPNDYHKGPIYFYLLRIPVYLLPWTVFLPLLFRRDETLPNALLRFLWVWFLLPLVFFSLSKAKGDYYMIMTIPPLMMLIAMQIQRVKIPKWVTVFMAGLLIPVLIFYLAEQRAREEKHSTIALTQFITAHHPDWPVYLYEDFEDISTVPLLLKHRVAIIDSKSADLYFGSHSNEAGNWFPSSSGFQTRATQQHVYVILKQAKLDQFMQINGHLGFKPILKNGNILLLSLTQT